MLDLDEKIVRPLRQPADEFASSINQSPLAAFLSIAKSVRAFYGLKLGAMGFHNGQDELLLIISETSVSVSFLADQLMVRPSTVSKMLDRLVAKGLVERVDDVRDARRTMVRITPAGIKARSLLIKMREEVDAEFNKALKGGSSSSGAGGEATALRHLNECAAMLVKQLRRIR